MNNIDVNMNSSCYSCVSCSKPMEKVNMTESQKNYCLECFLQLRQQSKNDLPMRVKSHQPTKIEAKPKELEIPSIEISKSVMRVRDHQPTKLKSTEPLKIPVEPLQDIPKSFFVTLRELSRKKSIARVNKLLENMHLLCATQEVKTYALTKRSNGGWSYGFIVDIDAKNITVCFNPETKDGKYVALESCSTIPSSFMKFIDSSDFNTGNELTKCMKGFTSEQIANLFVDWSKENESD